MQEQNLWQPFKKKKRKLFLKGELNVKPVFFNGIGIRFWVLSPNFIFKKLNHYKNKFEKFGDTFQNF